MFGDGIDPLGERHQYFLRALKRRLIIGYLDGLARGRQSLDGTAQQRHLAAKLGECPRRVILAHVFAVVVHILSLPAHPQAPAQPQIAGQLAGQPPALVDAPLTPQLPTTAPQERVHLGNQPTAIRLARSPCMALRSNDTSLPSWANARAASSAPMSSRSSSKSSPYRLIPKPLPSPKSRVSSRASSRLWLMPLSSPNSRLRPRRSDSTWGSRSRLFAMPAISCPAFSRPDMSPAR